MGCRLDNAWRCVDHVTERDSLAPPLLARERLVQHGLAVTAIVTPQDESYEHFGKNTEFQSTADKGGWHSDYPFSSQQGVNLEDFPPEVCFGCEYLTMIDGFTELNGVSSLSLSLSLLQSLSVSPSLSSGAKGNQVLCCLRRPR